MSKNKKGIIESLLSGILWAAYSVVLFELLNPYKGDQGDVSSLKGIMLLVLAALGIAFIDGLIALFFEIYFVIREGKFSEFKDHLFSDTFFKILPAAIFSGPLALVPFSIASRYSVSVATSITAFYPTLGSIIAIIYFKEKTSSKKFLGMVLAGLGIAVTSGFTNLNMIGVILAIVAAIGYALELVFGYRLLSDDIDPTISITLKQTAQIVVYAIMIFILVLVPGNFKYLIHVIQSIGFNEAYSFTTIFDNKNMYIFLFMILAAFFNASSYTFYYRGLSNAGVSTASSLNIAYGIWTIILLALPPFFVKISLLSLLGAALTFVGTAIVIVESERLESVA